jgi:formate dehydrogenase gamma subunit
MVARQKSGAATARQFLASGLVLFLLSFSPAPVRATPTDDECLICHKSSSLARDVGRSGSLTVEAGTLDRSAHAKLACVRCHRDATSAKHPPKLARVECLTCHSRQRDQLATSVHARVGRGGSPEAACIDCHGGGHAVAVASGRAMCARCHPQPAREYESSVHGAARAKGDADASTCRDCHGSAHEVLPTDDPRSRVSRDSLTTTCARCHEDRALMVKRHITIVDAVQLFRDSVHGRSSKSKAAHCNDCHESHRLRRADDPSSSIYRKNIDKTCGRCHRKEAAAYRLGVHGTALERGVTRAPVCTDCHGEHRIRGPRDPNSPVASAQVTGTCSHCHEATGIRETFGLPAGRLSTYKDSFHGLASRGGSPVVAECASCHGFHDILPSSDPRSLVSPQRLPQTCGRCHPGSEMRYQIGPVHVAMATPNQPPLYWTRLIYLVLIAGTIGFMALHNGLHFVRGVGDHLRVHLGHSAPHPHASERWFERMNVPERIQHFLLATSFFTLVFTGFALKFPETWAFSWLARMEGGYALRSNVHRVAAVIMVAVSLYHVGYLATKRGRKLVADLFPRLEDARDLLFNTLYLLGLRKEAARFDRFGYIEKAEYWALIWGTVVMTVTGGALWFENAALRVVPKWVLDLSTLIHYYEAWLAFLAIVVWHLYMNIANPDVYPMNWTWLTGRISEAQLRHEHYLEWQRIVAAEEQERQDREAAAKAGTPPPEKPAS